MPSKLSPDRPAVLPKDKTAADRLTAAPSHERHFYSTTRAFGRFGMRIFEPQLMAAPHWHGHIEVNFAIDHQLDYDVDSEMIAVPPNRLCLFWAGIPHQLTRIAPTGNGVMKLCNIYLPLDTFLMMTHITPMQIAMLGGGMAILPEALCDEDLVRRWYADYRSGDFERTEVMKMELNALFRRAWLERPEFLRKPQNAADKSRVLSSAHIGHVISMVQHTLENLG